MQEGRVAFCLMTKDQIVLNEKCLELWFDTLFKAKAAKVLKQQIIETGTLQQQGLCITVKSVLKSEYFGWHISGRPFVFTSLLKSHFTLTTNHYLLLYCKEVDR